MAITDRRHHPPPVHCAGQIQKRHRLCTHCVPMFILSNTNNKEIPLTIKNNLVPTVYKRTYFNKVSKNIKKSNQLIESFSSSFDATNQLIKHFFPPGFTQEDLMMTLAIWVPVC